MIEVSSLHRVTKKEFGEWSSTLFLMRKQLHMRIVLYTWDCMTASPQWASQRGIGHKLTDVSQRRKGLINRQYRWWSYKSICLYHASKMKKKKKKYSAVNTCMIHCVACDGHRYFSILVIKTSTTLDEKGREKT